MPVPRAKSSNLSSGRGRRASASRPRNHPEADGSARQWLSSRRCRTERQRGTESRIPARRAPYEALPAAPAFAATPPPRQKCRTPCSSAARSALATWTSITAAWNEAAMFGRSSGRPAACSRLTYVITAVLRRERGSRSRPSAASPAEGDCRGVAFLGQTRDRGPAGIPRPRSLATLSNASPAASSSVEPSVWYSPHTGTCTSEVCAARDNVRDEWRLEIGIRELAREDVAFQVVHSH